MIDLVTLAVACYVAGVLCGAAIGYAIANAPNDPDESESS